MIDWDRVRIFHTVAEAGSFTRAADRLGLSQSAISRQISALEDDLGAPLFHRHARGLVLTEQGDILLDTAREVARRMAAAQTALKESRDVPAGLLRISTTVGIGTVWLPAHLPEFLDRYPEISVSLLVSDGEVDLSMRQADVAVRLNRPTQADLIQRRLITFHTHIYGAPVYLDRRGRPQALAELDSHRFVSYGEEAQPPVNSLNWILYAGREEDENARPRPANLTCNNVYGMLRAVESGLGLASLPDYLAAASAQLERVLPTVDGPSYTAYFVYPEELRSSKRVAVFRDFLLEKVAAQAVW
jgi:DNA-binding transcriptional LysR family regulator